MTKDIKVGKATICYHKDKAEGSGWVLPGGKRTNNRALATQTAERINNLIRRSTH